MQLQRSDRNQWGKRPLAGPVRIKNLSLVKWTLTSDPRPTGGQSDNAV